MALLKTYTNNSISRADLYHWNKGNLFLYAVTKLLKGYQVYEIVGSLRDNSAPRGFRKLSITKTRRRSEAIAACEKHAATQLDRVTRNHVNTVYVTFEYTEHVVAQILDRQEAAQFEIEVLKLNVG